MEVLGRLRLSGCLAACVQYPAEKEITFPPFTCLESDGDPRLERTTEGETVLFPLKVSVLPPPHTHTPFVEVSASGGDRSLKYATFDSPSCVVLTFPCPAHSR